MDQLLRAQILDKPRLKNAAFGIVSPEIGKILDDAMEEIEKENNSEEEEDV